jgi:hypothetical protein
MRPTRLHRFVAALAAFALMVTTGLQSMQAAAMVSMKSDMSMSALADAAAGNRSKCDGMGKGVVTQCQTVSICVPSIAVLPIATSISTPPRPARFEAENMSFDGRTGTPELHPPKSTVLR